MMSGSETPVPALRLDGDAEIVDSDQVLRDLIETLVDGVRGYRTAADRVDDAELAALMRARAEKRRAVVEDLMRTAGGRDAAEDVDFDGTASGGLHRGWITVQGAIAGDGAVVKSAIAGEEHALEQCEEALREGVTAEAATVVRRAAADIRQAIDSLTRRVA
jgi:uncharacterized protein (TIGR02284 family)